MTLTAVVPAAAQRLPNRLHGPVRIDSSPKIEQRSQTIKRRTPPSGAPNGAAANGAANSPVVKQPIRRSSPSLAIPTPGSQTPLPTKRALNGPVPDEQRQASPALQDRSAPVRNGPVQNRDVPGIAPVVVRTVPNGISAQPEKSAPLPATAEDANPVSEARLKAEQPPRGAPEAAQGEGERLAQLRKERFRRRAAESAQKEIEQMAVQLHEQLGKEVSARRKAEGVAADLVSRASLENQIDKERDRLRTEKIKKLEQRRVLLEREVSTLTQRLAQERAKRRQLEQDKAALTQAVAAAQPKAGSETEFDTLKSKVAELTRKLNAAEWARKLAEAQLRVITRRRGAKPSTAAGQSN
ncbi:MAG: hypothetical protein JXQ99_18875 [Hyphomicrobiaceae bacterium]